MPADIPSVGFIQVNPYEGGNSQDTPVDSLSQVLSLDVGATYNISFLENARAFQSIFPDVEVTVGSTVIQQGVVTAVGSNNPFNVVTGTFTATSSAETLTFLVSQQNPNDDATLLVTDVDVSATPEPSTALIAAAGLCLLAVFRLKRAVLAQ